MAGFGDITKDDVYTEGDELVNWDEVDAVQAQIEFINSIEDDEERLDAAADWAIQLSED